MRRTIWIWTVCSLFLTIMISCTNGQASESSQMNYNEIKTMVMDILKTEEAKKEIKKATEGDESPQLRILSTGNGEQVKIAVKDVLTNLDSNELIKAVMKDPKFAGDFAKALEKETKKLYKDLLKDPEYQKSLIEVMDNPDYQQIVLSTMKNPQYKQQTMAIIQDSIENPLFRMELIPLLRKAVKEEMQMTQEEKKGGKKGEQKKGEDKGGGGEGEGGGGESGGEGGGEGGGG